jgi:hypothetical protein
MKTYLFFATLFFSILCCQFAPAQEIHIAKHGKDSNSGSKEKPLASFEAAKTMARNLRRGKQNPKIIVHQGVYDLNKSFVLNKEDGGEQGNPVIWAAAPGEKVHITGGKSLPADLFKLVKDKNILARLDPAARKQVRCIDLKNIGITNFGRHIQYGHALPVVPAPLELFVNGEPMTLARYPDAGNIKIGKVVDKGSVPRIGDKSNRGPLFHYTDDRHARWSGMKNIWLQGTFNYGFADDYSPVEYIDSVKKQIKLFRPHLYGVASGLDYQQYIAINILEELTQPGEWYVDEGIGVLYLWPTSSLQNAQVQVSILEEPIIAIEGASHLRIEGMTVEVGRGIGVYMENCTNVVIAGCTVRNVGTCGIFMGQGARLLDESSSVDDYVGEPQSGVIGSLQNHLYFNNAWNRNAGSNNGILSCDIYNTGSGGVFLSGGDKKTLTNGNSYVKNCRIHYYNRRNKFIWAGINVDGCGNTVSNNEIYNSDWQGIFVHGNEHLFEYNHIHDVTLNSNDTSPWYIGRNPSDRGNVVRYNYLDNCGNPNRMTMGIYCDDSSTDVLVFGNVFNNMKTNHGVLFSNSGWELVMKNNIVINPISHTAVISAHYYTWAMAEAKTMLGKNGLIRKRLEEEVNFRVPPYSEKYPTLLPYLDEIREDKEWQGMRSRGNLLEGNLIVGGPEEPLHLMGGQYAQMDTKNNWVTKEDPGFVDMKNKNFSLKPDAKVFQMIPGFENIPFHKMGIHKDEYRK